MMFNHLVPVNFMEKVCGLDVHKDPLIQELRTYTLEYRMLTGQHTKVLTQMNWILVMCGIRLSS